MPKGYKRYTKLPRDKDGLTPNQRAFAENAAILNGKESARLAYPNVKSDKSLEVIAAQNMANPKIVLSIAEIADKVGLGKYKCAGTIANALEAKNESTDAFGRSHSTPDHRTRLKAAELGLKLHGELKDNNTMVPVPVTKEAYQALCDQFWTSKPDKVIDVTPEKQ